jgi:hypothetical protein
LQQDVTNHYQIAEPDEADLDLATIAYVATNLALCCELYIKACLAIENRMVPRIHNIRKLFCKVSPQLRKEIVERFDTQTLNAGRSSNKGVGTLRINFGPIGRVESPEARIRETRTPTIGEVLRDSQNLYERFRYIASAELTDQIKIVYRYSDLLALCDAIDYIIRRKLHNPM